jgi:fumarate hydratase class I
MKDVLLELIKKTSTTLPQDVLGAIKKAVEQEEVGTPARYAMDTILENIRIAEEKAQPICQDTGSILFFVKAPCGFSETKFIGAAREAVAEATLMGYLRQNSVDPISGKNSGNNLGPGSPYIHFEERAGEDIDIRLMLKGGGCENCGIQYSLPDTRIGANRNMEGVKKCILDAVFQAQGNGCAPGFLGVSIGGDRSSGYLQSKEELLRKVDDKNPNPILQEMEDEILEKANKLGIGPMGFGGKVTLLGCKIGYLNRLPASYFVTVSYMCWAFRRQGIVLDKHLNIKEWLY